MNRRIQLWIYDYANRYAIHGKPASSALKKALIKLIIIFISIGVILFFSVLGILALEKSTSWGLFINYLKDGGKSGVANYIIYRNLGLMIAGFIGIYLAWSRSNSLKKQATTAEQGHFSERFLRATEQLNSEKLFVRIGGIHTLWLVAKETSSQGDKKMIVDMLCAFIRESKPEVSSEYDTSHKYKHIQKDVQLALNLITKNLGEIDLLLDYQVDLSNSFLQGANISNANLYWANLQNSNLEDANLSSARMQKAILKEANLKSTIFYNAELQYANFEKANLIDTNLIRTDLWGAKFKNVTFSDTTFHKVWLTQRLCKDLNIIDHQMIKKGTDEPIY